MTKSTKRQKSKSNLWNRNPLEFLFPNRSVTPERTKQAKQMASQQAQAKQMASQQAQAKQTAPQQAQAKQTAPQQAQVKPKKPSDSQRQQETTHTEFNKLSPEKQQEVIRAIITTKSGVHEILSALNTPEGGASTDPLAEDISLILTALNEIRKSQIGLTKTVVKVGGMLQGLSQEVARIKLSSQP